MKKIKFKTVLSLVEKKTAKFGKIDICGRLCKKEPSQTRINLVNRLVLLAELLNCMKKDIRVVFDLYGEIEESSRDSYYMYDILNSYVHKFVVRNCPFVEVFLSFTKSVCNPHKTDETIIMELSQIILFGDFGDMQYRYENSKLIRDFFLNDSFIGLDTLIYDFNRHALENKKIKTQKRDEESLKYQRANREKINQYLRDKPKASQRKKKLEAKKSPDDTTADDTTLSQNAQKDKKSKIKITTKND